MRKKIGIIMVAHGSKWVQSNEEFMQLAEKIKLDASMDFSDIQYAFLEFADPSIETTIEKMCTHNIDEIYIYPYFLNSGKHVVVDIPNIVSKMQEICKNIKIKIIKHFGESESIPSIISSDLKNIL
ncbi:MAG: sirohydrochlorin ferrochelatase [Sulfurimonas sp.]|jgi:sirohydrochlorin ferrochelatase